MSVKKDQRTTRTFEYRLRDVTLNFQLNIDRETEMRDFLTLLKEAVEDVEATLKERKEK